MVVIICPLVEIGLTNLPKSGPGTLQLLQACVLVHSQVVQNGLKLFVKKHYYLEILAFSQIISSISILSQVFHGNSSWQVNMHFLHYNTAKSLTKSENSFHASLMNMKEVKIPRCLFKGSARQIKNVLPEFFFEILVKTGIKCQ